ncbi:MAG: hypothetical protein II966_02470 [Lachnospiraceae bacterium]|nr:hypothetical protein [Lachnospiraceae bacterium]
MADSIFREKSLERVSSPEKLNDYIRVTTPSVWVILIATFLILFGAIVWSIFGRINIHDEQGNVQNVAPITFVTN